MLLCCLVRRPLLTGRAQTILPFLFQKHATTSLAKSEDKKRFNTEVGFFNNINCFYSEHPFYKMKTILSPFQITNRF